MFLSLILLIFIVFFSHSIKQQSWINQVCTYALNVNIFSLSNLLKMTWLIWLLKATTKTNKFLSKVVGTRRGGKCHSKYLQIYLQGKTCSIKWLLRSPPQIFKPSTVSKTGLRKTINNQNRNRNRKQSWKSWTEISTYQGRRKVWKFGGASIIWWA